jgi:hypothetical protein
MGYGDMWGVYTNRGLPPSFNYVQGVEPWPMDFYNTHPLTVGTNTYEYFELVSVAPPKPHDVLVCMRLGGEWTTLATVGTGTNVNGFTNEDFEVWSSGGEWNINATAACKSKYQSMFWTAKPK